MCGAEILGLLGHRYTMSASGWLSCSCLFAKHHHKTGVDRTPSARLAPDGNGYKCFSCGVSYAQPNRMLWKLYNLNASKNINNEKVNTALSFVLNNKQPPYLPTASVEQYSYAVDKSFIQFPKEYLAKFPSVLLRNSTGDYAFPEAIKFLASRKTPKQVIEDFDFRWDAEFKRVLVPSYLKGKILAGFEGRNILFNPNIQGENTEPKYWIYTHKPTKQSPAQSNIGIVWFRQSSLSQKKPLVIVEGMFDAARVYQHYRNVTAIGGASVSPTKLQYLKECKQIFMLPDNDPAGEESVAKLKKMLPYMIVIPIPLPAKDAGEMSSIDVRNLLQPHLKLSDPIWTQADKELYLIKND